MTANRIPTEAAKVGSSVSTLSAEDLRHGQHIFLDDALRTLPSISITQTGSRGSVSDIRIRGEEAYRTLVLLDGLEISDPAGTQVSTNLANLLAGNTEKVEVLRGPQSMLYGADAIGGVVSIQSKRGAEGLEGTMQAEYGSYDSYGTSASLLAGQGPFDVSLFGARYETSGFSSKSGDLSLADDDGYDNWTAHGVLGVEPAENIRIESVLRYVTGRSEFDGFSGDPDRLLLTDEFAVRVVAKGQFLDDRLSSKLAYNFFDTRRDDLSNGVPFAFGSKFDGKRHKLESENSFEIIENQTILIGGDFEDEEIVTDTGNGEADIWGVYGQWQGEFKERLFLTAGMRFDEHSTFGEHLGFRGTAAFLTDLLGQGDGSTKFRASAGSGFRPPSLFEIAFNESSPSAPLPDLREEKSFGWDVGIEQSALNDALQIELTYFQTRIKDELRFDNVAFDRYFQADGNTVSKGIELGVAVNPLANLTIAANYTFTESEVNSPDAEDGLPRVRRPKHLANVRANYTFFADRANINLIVRGAAEIQDGFREFRTVLEDYMTVDLGASFRIHENAEIYGKVINLFNADYQEVDGFNTPDASGFGGIRISF